MSPRRLADRLHLVPAARVLEIGPGPGYFSVEGGFTVNFVKAAGR